VPNGPKTIKAKLNRVLVSSEPIQAAHRFLYTRVGAEIVLDVGYFDLPDLKEKVDAAKGVPGAVVESTFFVTHRFSLSPEAAAQLAETVNMLVKNLKDVGMIDTKSEDSDGN
jgi:hypothetical protein